MPQPHDTWANYYDFVYKRTFGEIYDWFTQLTLDVISEILDEGKILDFGAGTGRLTIPLKQRGYEVIAIEKSKEMTKVLRQKCVDYGLEVPIFNCSIAEYSGEDADLALALFTVLSYSTTEEEIRQCIYAISRHIKPGGYFFFDLPGRAFFQDARPITNIDMPNFRRVVSLTRKEGDVYIYEETCNGLMNGEKFHYEDKFLIRYWSVDTIDALLREHRMVDTERNLDEFRGTGSTYKLYRKS